MVLNTLAPNPLLEFKNSVIYCLIAQEYCHVVKYADAYKWTSCSFYNLAGISMQRSDFKEASQLFLNSMSLLKEYQISIKEEDKSVELLVAKRCEAMVICFLSLAELKV